MLAPKSAILLLVFYLFPLVLIRFLFSCLSEDSFKQRWGLYLDLIVVVLSTSLDIVLMGSHEYYNRHMWLSTVCCCRCFTTLSEVWKSFFHLGLFTSSPLLNIIVSSTRWRHNFCFIKCDSQNLWQKGQHTVSPTFLLFPLFFLFWYCNILSIIISFLIEKLSLADLQGLVS